MYVILQSDWSIKKQKLHSRNPGRDQRLLSSNDVMSPSNQNEVDNENESMTRP